MLLTKIIIIVVCETTVRRRGAIETRGDGIERGGETRRVGALRTEGKGSGARETAGRRRRRRDDDDDDDGK